MDNVVNGVLVGIVKENQDPENLGRVQIEFPFWQNPGLSEWARITTAMAGEEKGIYFLPEVGDEVLVAFEGGNIHAPYVIGSLWNGKDKPPQTNDGDNNIRMIKSRKGHEIVFDDSDEAKLVIKSSSGHEITLDDASGGENLSIVDKSGNKISIDATQNAIPLDCSGQFAIKANIIEIEAQANLKVSAGAILTLEGAMVQIN